MCTSAEKLPEGQCICEHIFFLKGEERLIQEQSCYFITCILGFEVFSFYFFFLHLYILLTSCLLRLNGEGQNEKQKLSTGYKHCSAIGKTLVCCQCCFGQKCDTQYCVGCSEEN